MIRTLIAPGRDTDLIGLDLADLAAGETLDHKGNAETVVVVLSGMVDVRADEAPLGPAGGRDSVFFRGRDMRCTRRKAHVCTSSPEARCSWRSQPRRHSTRLFLPSSPG